MSTKNNTQTRRSLAEQIDRLDSILTGLADQLHEAVAMSVTCAVKEVVSIAIEKAVHTALVEVMENVELQKRLTASQPSQVGKPQVPEQTGYRLGEKVRKCWSWLTSKARAIWSRITTSAVAAGSLVMRTISSAITGLSNIGQQVRQKIIRRGRVGWMMAAALVALALRFRTRSMVALAAGSLLGLASYQIGPLTSAAACGLTGGILTLASGMLTMRIPSSDKNDSTDATSLDWII